MPYLDLLYDMRLPDFADVAADQLYAAMLEQATWADALGFDVIQFGEHHTADDGYLPSTATAAAAVAGRRTSVRLRVMAVAPFHHPIRLAEDLAVLDLLSGGRACPVVLAGYRPAEFELFAARREDRRATVRRTVQVLQQAWTGQPFEFDGRMVRVTPTPVQSPRPPVLMGGSHASVGREAAQIADGFRAPGAPYEAFRAECLRIGRPDPGPWPTQGPEFLFVSEDPDRTWQQIGHHVLHAIGSYAAWTIEGRGAASSRFPRATTVAELMQSSAYRVVTPDECVEIAHGIGPDGVLRLQPLMGGIHPDLAWESLDLFAGQVLPRIEARRGREPGVIPQAPPGTAQGRFGR